MNKLIPLLAFSILFLVPLVTQDAFAVTKTYVGASGGNWNLDANWNPNGVPNQNDDVILDSNNQNVIINSAVTVGPTGSITLSPTSINNNLLIISNSGSLLIFGTLTMNNINDDILISTGGNMAVQCGGIVTLGNGMISVPFVGGATLVNHGTITGTNFNNIIVGINGIFTNSGILTAGIQNTGGTFNQVAPICIIGGEIIPVNTTSLLLAGFQSFSWMIPVLLSGIGIGLFVVSRKSENS